MQLNKQELIKLVKGASLLTTGGGLSLKEQLVSLEKHHNISISLRSLESFDPDAILVTTSEVGLADATEMEKKDILPRMLQTWEKMTGQKISGVYAAEIGQESILIDTAIGLNVPLADFDVAGGRAVPFVDINSIHAAGIPYSMAPLVAATDKGDIVALDSRMSPDDIEIFLRSLSRLSKSGIAFFIGGAIRAGDISGRGVENRSLSLAVQLGACSTMDEIIGRLQPDTMLSGHVVGYETVQKSGFNCYHAKFKDIKGAVYTIFILNELLILTDEHGRNLAEPPDKILVIDVSTLSGVATKDFLSGKEVSLLCVPAEPIWKREKGLELFGRARFID